MDSQIEKKKCYTFYKYSASGNDFIITHVFVKADYTQIAQRLCDRCEGIGADGLVVLMPSDQQEVDMVWDFYNSDGSPAAMCGNATRAVAHYAYYHHLVASATMRLQTVAGVIAMEVDGNRVQSAMTVHKELKAPFMEYDRQWWLVDTGVPHLVTIGQDLEEFDLSLCRDMRNRYEANVNVIVIDSVGDIHIRTFERGVEGETLACGTGMVAAFLWARVLHKVGDETTIYPKSKAPIICRWQYDRVYFKGAVNPLFNTQIWL